MFFEYFETLLNEKGNIFIVEPSLTLNYLFLSTVVNDFTQNFMTLHS